MKKFIAIILITTSVLLAQNAGSTGVAFLKNGNDAKIISMSDLGVVGDYSAKAAFYNPAIIQKYTNHEIYFNHSNLFNDISNQSITGSFEFIGLPWVVSSTNTSINGIEVREKPGEKLTEFDAKYFFFSFGTGFTIIDKISFGISYKYIYENIWSEDASGSAIDIGFTYDNIFENIDFGISFRNMGSMEKLKNVGSKLPSDYRFGFSHHYENQSMGIELNSTAGIQKYNDLDDYHVHFGTELGYKHFIFFRAGYVTGYDSKGISAGLGLKYKGIIVDYGYTKVDYNLGDINSISIGYSFN